MELCCTCATYPTSPPTDKSEKTVAETRALSCCSRLICGNCILKNPRFSQYCPFCQISDAPSSLPQGLREPPSYTALGNGVPRDAPPPYPSAAGSSAAINSQTGAEFDEKNGVTEDTLHFLDHENDTVASLALRYGVPIDALRRTNNLTSDHLLQGRKTVLIPGEFYKGGVSHSPRPVEGEEEELRKRKIRRFMTSCKVSEYDVALLYLEQSNYDLQLALQTYQDDEAWERENPQGGAAGKTKQKNEGPFWRRLPWS